MSALALGAFLLVAFLAVEVASARGDGRRRRWPLLALCIVVAAGAVELARYDHGRADALLWIGFVSAPVVVIFGGAAEGARRWYGWPDLGPIPGRLAILGASILVGVLAGVQVRESDVLASIARGETIRREILAWRDAHGGAYPATLDAAAPDAPTTRMGSFGPPPFRYDAGRRELAFPLGTSALVRNDLAAPTSAWTRRSP